MINRIWTVSKAAFGIGLVVVGALYAAQKLDRERAAQWSLRTGGVEEPELTGSLKSLARIPRGPTQGPSR
ncbi:hypothetical protein [Methylobacterium nigriterrae]|uniref:hypothetical protein n=1 Tax=Methylobacterium nigriterrae TaxID=3127512 RepID=UPI003013CF31